MTTVRSWRMIEAEMYGMMPRANTVSRRRLPPEKRSTMPRRPLCIWLKRAARAVASMPGVGTWAPSR
jgi:hypothetical protein